MQTKKLFLIVCPLMVLGLLLESCAGAAPTTVARTATAPAAVETPAAKTSLTPATPVSTPKPAVNQPRYGGTLNIATQGDPPSFDIHTEISNMVLGPFGAVYSGLVQSDPADPYKIAPDLAEKWDVSTDGTILTFHLRQGVRFHDGSPLSAADAVASLERLNAKSPWVGSVFQQVIVKIDAPDTSTVRITLKHAYSPFFSFLALNCVGVAPQRLLEAKGDLKRDVVGTGAFKFSRYDPGTAIKFVKNEGYFIKGRPYLDGITFYPIKDGFTRLAAFRTNRAQIIYPAAMSTQDANVVRRDMPAANVEQMVANWWTIYLNVDRKPWDDVRVRRAVHLALDRQKAMDVVDPGAAALYGFIPPNLGGFSDTELLKLPGWRQPKDEDRTEAKKLLVEAGYAEGFKTTMLTRSGTAYETFATFVRDQLKTIGITADIDVKVDAAFYAAETERNFSLHPNRQGMNVQDADHILPTYYLTGSPKNFSGFSSKELDDLIAKQSGTSETEKRKEIIRETEKKLIDLVPAVISHWGSYWITWSAEVKGFVRPAGNYNDMKHIETWLSR